MKQLLYIAAIVVLITTGCGPISESDSYWSEDGQIQYFINSETDLYQETGDSGITDSGAAPSSQPSASRIKVTDNWGYGIRHIARVLPLKASGEDTQANDIVLSDDGLTAVVAYNTAGAVFNGGLQILDISNSAEPTISASIPLPGMDIHALLLDGATLYFGGMQDPDSVGTAQRCFIAKADITTITETNALDTMNDTLNSLLTTESYAVTGIALKDTSLYVSLGAANGGLIKLDPDTLGSGSKVDDIEGIRDIEAYNKGIIALTGPVDGSTTDGGINDYRSDTLDNSLTITGFGNEEYKATVEVYNNRYAILGLSLKGLKVVDLKSQSDSGTLSESDYMFELPNPTADWTTLTHTNSVSYFNDLIFSANGEYGFRVLKFVQGNNWDKKGIFFARVIGYASFEDHPTENGYWSANQIVYRNNIIIVASGEGGVNIYRTRIR